MKIIIPKGFITDSASFKPIKTTLEHDLDYLYPKNSSYFALLYKYIKNFFIWRIGYEVSFQNKIKSGTFRR